MGSIKANPAVSVTAVCGSVLKRCAFKLVQGWRYIKRGILFYWYTGQRAIAVTSLGITVLLYMLLLWATGATSLVMLVLLIFMDHLLLIFLLVYLIVVRSLVPDLLSSELDALMLQYSLPILLGWLANRLIANLVATKLFGCKI